MKKLLRVLVYGFSLGLSVLLIYSFSDNPSNQSSQLDNNKIEIRDLIINEVTYNNICVRLEKSKVPIVSGLDDVKFQSMLNSMFYDFFQDNLSVQLKQLGGCTGKANNLIDGQDGMYYDMAEISFSYNIYTFNDSVLCINLYYASFFGYGAAERDYNEKLIVVNLKTRTFFGPEDFNLDYTKREFYNKNMKKYYSQHEQEYLTLDVPLIKTPKDFYSNKYILKNDTVWVSAYYQMGYSWGEILVPIDKW